MQRENARDDENDLAESDFGPVVNRIPSSDHLEHADRTVSTQVPSSFVEELDEESKLESAQIAGPDPNALVDHVHTRGHSRRNAEHFRQLINEC